MKKIIFPVVVLTTISLMSFVSASLHTDIFKVNTKLSVLEWYAEKLTGKHNGTIGFAGGEIKNNHGTLTGSFEIDMTTIANADLEDGEWQGKLENHLKSPDFFDVEKYPRSKFVIISVTPVQVSETPGITHNVKGLLTIKDRTNEISFNAEIKIQDKLFSCKGLAVIDRSKFDVKYRSKTFFPEVGDKMIYDEFKLKFNVVANF